MDQELKLDHFNDCIAVDQADVMLQIVIPALTSFAYFFIFGWLMIRFKSRIRHLNLVLLIVWLV